MSIEIVKNLGESGPDQISITQLDISSLIGHKIVLFSDQFPNRPLDSRVIAATRHTVAIDRSGGSGLVNNLVNNQRLTVRMEYKGETIAIRGTLKRIDGGRCQVLFDDTVQPLFRRRYPRIFHCCSVKLAPLRIQTFSREQLARLRWMMTETINLSGGGTLLSLSANLEKPVYLLLNIGCSNISFPALLLGQVCHCKQKAVGQFDIGIEFLPREDQERLFSSTIINQLPPILSAYDDVRRALLSRRIVAWMHDENH
ncbi:MAG: PilZ domain-containing protein [candidate division Zixibacteria bacterium]|nr:PilZ domain-containing protein [candidate division Zixibacteria bacterium]